MLTITPEQRAALDAEFDARMALRLSAQVAELYPENLADVPDAARDESMRRAVAEARALGLRANAAVASFAHMCAAIGPEFHLHPEIAARIAALGDARDRLFAALPDEIPEAAWEEAAADGKRAWARLKEARR